MEPTETEVNIQELSHQTLSANRAGMMLDFLCAICVAGRRGGGGGGVLLGTKSYPAGIV